MLIIDHNIRADRASFRAAFLRPLLFDSHRGKMEDEGRSFARLAVDQDLSPVASDDSKRDAHSETGVRYPFVVKKGSKTLFLTSSVIPIPYR